MSQIEGIVLRTVDYGENHLIVTLLTTTVGKLAIMARGAKKTTSPLRACTTLFTQSIFQVYGTKMPSLSQAELINSFRAVKTDLIATAYAAYAAELIDRVLPEGEAVAGVYALFNWAMLAMERGQDPEMCIRVIEARMLDFAGVMPDWMHCSACQGLLSESPFFSPSLGGPLHMECSYRDPHAIVTKATLHKLIYTLQKLPLSRMGDISVSDQARAQMSRIFQYLLEDYAGIYLRSRRFLESLQTEGN